MQPVEIERPAHLTGLCADSLPVDRMEYAVEAGCNVMRQLWRDDGEMVGCMLENEDYGIFKLSCTQVIAWSMMTD
jgi:hypothetical protein